MRETNDRAYGRALRRPARHGRRILLTMVTMTAMLGALISGNASPSFAATSGSGGIYQATKVQQTTWWMENWNTGRCVADSAAYGLRAIACDGYNYQVWL